MRAKISSTCCRTRISGCTRPIGSSRAGSVTSTVPAGGRVASSDARLASSADSISAFRVLTRWPNSRRSSGGIVPRLLRSAVTEPDLRLRNASLRPFRAWSVDAEESCAWNASRNSSIDGWVVGSGIRRGGERGLGLRSHLGERCGLGGGQVGQHLAVDRDARRLESAHQLRVGEPVFARGGVNPDDPQPAIVALLLLPADEGVLAGGIDRFLRGAIQLALGLVEAFGARQQLLALGAADGSSLYAWHGEFLFIRQHPPQFRRILLGHFPGAAHLPLRLRRLARENVALEGARPDDLTCPGLLEALGGAPMCFQLRHFVCQEA